MEYTFKTKQMIKVSEEVGKYYDLEKALYDSDLDTLAKLVSIFGNVKKEEAFNFIDEQLDNGKTIKELYTEIFTGINQKGFFNQKLEVELEALPLDIDKLTQEMYEKYKNVEIEKQISKTSENM